MVLPLHHAALNGRGFGEASYEALKSKHTLEFSEAQWDFMRQELEFVGGGVDADMGADVRYIFEQLRGKTVIVLILNSQVGNNRWILGEFGKVNAIVQPLAAEFGYQTINLSELVRGTEDLVSPDDAGVHFSRNVYTRLAGKISEAIAGYKQPEERRDAA
jgi:hypothetical protein